MVMKRNPDLLLVFFFFFAAGSRSMNRNGESLHDEKATGNLRTRGAQPLKHSSSRVPDLQFQPSSTKSKRRRRLEIGTEKLKTEHGIKPLTVLG